MLAWMLRAILSVEVLGLALLHPGLAEQVGWLGAVIALVGLFVVLQGLLLLPAYVIAVVGASPRPAGIGGPTIASFIAEWFGFVLAFALIMPFERVWMGSDTVGRVGEGRRPVLLVHGYMCNRGFWWWIRRELRARGFAVATITLETPISDIEALADRLVERIDALIAETGADKVALVTHSMGGLVARAALRKAGTARISRFVTLGGPHHGTVVARLGLGRNARQMEPGNPWLGELNAVETTDVPTLTVWSTGDQIVVPQATSRLAGAREAVVAGMGHVAMAFSPRIRDLIVADLSADDGAAKPTSAA
jgi:triacylglycerol lipase